MKIDPVSADDGVGHQDINQVAAAATILILQNSYFLHIIGKRPSNSESLLRNSSKYNTFIPLQIETHKYSDLYNFTFHYVNVSNL